MISQTQPLSTNIPTPSIDCIRDKPIHPIIPAITGISIFQTIVDININLNANTLSIISTLVAVTTDHFD